MKELEIHLEEVKAMLENYREVIKGINHHIENEGFRPTELQQKQISSICSEGRELIEIISKLEKTKNT